MECEAEGAGAAGTNDINQIESMLLYFKDRNLIAAGIYGEKPVIVLTALFAYITKPSGSVMIM